MGKTRLALEAARAVADRFPGGAARQLDGAEDAGVLVPGAASALGVVAATAAELGEQLDRTTRGAPALLVLDGCERFNEGVETISHVLAAVANLTVLATSRRCGGGQARLPGPAAGSAERRSVVRRARRGRRGRGREIDDEQPIVDAICARLDQLLAIELAADGARLLPLPALC